MFRAMRSRVLSAAVLLAAVVIGVCLAEDCIRVHVNINPYKIVLNAEGQADSIQANIPIVLASANITDFGVTLLFDGEEVAAAESARYCVIDDILIIGFDRTDLQNNPDVIEMAGRTVTATVDGWVIVTVMDENDEETEITTEFFGSDTVEIVKPGKKK